MAGSWVEEHVPCRDPECPGPAEPEGDDEVRWFAYMEGGMEFGYQRAVAAPQGTCQLGISEGARLRVSGPVPVQIGRRPPGAQTH
jgi:hypothetical protein